METYQELKDEIKRIIKKVKSQDRELGEHFEKAIIFDDKNETFCYAGEEGVELTFS